MKSLVKPLAKIKYHILTSLLGVLLLLTFSCTPGLKYVNICNDWGSFDEGAKLEEISKFPKGSTVYIDVSSNGGDLRAAISFYNTILNWHDRFHVVTIANGFTESAALILWLAGEERQIRKNTKFMTHCGQLAAGWTWERVGQVLPEDNLAKLQQEFLRLDLACYQILADNSCQDLEWWESKLGHLWLEPPPENFYFGPDEARKLFSIERSS